MRREAFIAAAFVTLLAVGARPTGARPQGSSLPVADLLVPKDGSKLQPEKGGEGEAVKLHDLTLGSRRTGGPTDDADVKFQFPPGGDKKVLVDSSTDDVQLKIASGSPSSGSGKAIPGTPGADVQFSFPGSSGNLPAGGADSGVSLPSLTGAGGGQGPSYDYKTPNSGAASPSKLGGAGDFDQFGGGSLGQFGAGGASENFGGGSGSASFGSSGGSDFGQFGGGGGIGAGAGSSSSQFGGGGSGPDQFGGSSSSSFGASGGSSSSFGGSDFGGSSSSQFGAGGGSNQFGAGSSDPFGSSSSSSFGASGSNQFGAGSSDPFGSSSSSSFGAGGSSQFGAGSSDPFGASGSAGQFGGSSSSSQFGGSASSQFGAGGSDQFGAGSGLGLDQVGSGSSQFGAGGADQFGASGSGQFGASGSGQFGASGSDQFGAGSGLGLDQVGSGSSQFGAGGADQFGASGSGQFGASGSGQFGAGGSDQFGSGSGLGLDQVGSGSSQFGAGGAGQFGASSSTQFGGDKPSKTPDLPLPSSPGLDVKLPAAPVQNLGDGNQKVFNNRHSHVDLLSHLLPGHKNRQHVGHGAGGGAAPNRNPIGDILALGANPIKKIFNVLTLGAFDGNSQHQQSNPLGGLLSRLSLGLLGGGHQSGAGLDLSAIGLGQEALGELVQVASSGLDDLARETSAGIRLAQDEVRFQAGEKVRQFINGLQQTGRTAGVIGQNTYRSLLQKKDALAKLLVGIVTNLGRYVNTSVGDTFEKVGNTANVVGKFLNDLKVGLLNSLISKGENVRELVSGTLGSVGSAVKDFTSAAQSAAEDNIRAITGLTDKKFSS